jgi:hypothetical protein
MLDAFTRAMRKPQQALAYTPGLAAPPGAAPLIPGTRLRREPDGPVSMKTDSDTNVHVPSPFRIGYSFNFVTFYLFYSIFSFL